MNTQILKVTLLILFIFSFSFAVCSQNSSGRARTFQQLTNPEYIYGEAVLKGKISGYIPKEDDQIEIRTGDPITGETNIHFIKVATDGLFEAKIPMISTRSIHFIGLDISEQFYLSATEETQVHIDLDKKAQARGNKDIHYIQFEGANAEVNNELFHKVYNRMDTSNPMQDAQFFKTMAGMTPIEYRDYLQSLENGKLEEIKSLGISEELERLLVRQMKFITLVNLANGDILLRNANSSGNYEEPDFDKEYYAILKDFPVNEMAFEYTSSMSLYLSNLNKLRPLFMMSLFEENYEEMLKMGLFSSSDIEIAKFQKSLAIQTNPKMSTDGLNNNIKTLEALKKTGLLKENKLYVANRLSAITQIKTAEEYFEYYNLIINLKYPEVINDSIYESMDLSPVDMPRDLSKDTISINKMRNLGKDPELANQLEVFRSVYGNVFKLYEYFNLLNGGFMIFKEISGVDSGLFFDLALTQSISRRFEEMIPLEENDFKFIRYKVKNPFFVEHLTRKNNELIAKIEKEKKNPYNVHNVPETDNDKILHEIMEPHKGKVILVDFWNTWCGPCRQQIKEFAPEKETYKGKDVVFLYLADDSSPEDQWKNMIPGIGGEHYRLTKEQMDHLRQKFGFSGIPYYIIFSKEGEVAYSGYLLEKEVLDKELSK